MKFQVQYQLTIENGDEVVFLAKGGVLTYDVEGGYDVRIAPELAGSVTLVDRVLTVTGDAEVIMQTDRRFGEIRIFKAEKEDLSALARTWVDSPDVKGPINGAFAKIGEAIQFVKMDSELGSLLVTTTMTNWVKVFTDVVNIVKDHYPEKYDELLSKLDEGTRVKLADLMDL